MLTPTKAYSPLKPESKPDSDDKENDDLFIANVLVADVLKETEVAAASLINLRDSEVQYVHSSEPEENTGIALLLKASNNEEVVLIPEKWTRGRQRTFPERMEDLKRFKEQHGHLKVTNVDDRPLASWCSVLRFARKNPKKGSIRLTEEQIAALDSIGFNWTSMEYITKTFDERIADLQAYKLIHVHVNVRAIEDNR